VAAHVLTRVTRQEQAQPAGHAFHRRGRLDQREPAALQREAGPRQRLVAHEQHLGAGVAPVGHLDDVGGDVPRARGQGRDHDRRPGTGLEPGAPHARARVDAGAGVADRLQGSAVHGVAHDEREPRTTGR
jgi:hypothetical protein